MKPIYCDRKGKMLKMMKRNVFAACAVSFVFVAGAFAHDGHDHGAEAAGAATIEGAPVGEYRLDPSHAYVTLTYSHLGFSRPTIGFKTVDATLVLDPDDPAKSRVNVTIGAASVESLVVKLNEQLIAPDFFDAAGHPEITFVSTQALQSSVSEGKIFGDLTIKGVTKPAVLDVTLNKAGKNPITGKEMIGVSAHTHVLRSEWGLDAYVPAVSDEVEIHIEAEFEYQD